MKNFILVVSVFLLIGASANSQDVVCKMPLNSPWVKSTHETGFDYKLGDAELHNFLQSAKTAKYVYLYFNRSGSWKMVTECAIPKNYIKTFFFKNGIQYGFTTDIKERPTEITLVKVSS